MEACVLCCESAGSFSVDQRFNVDTCRVEGCDGVQSGNNFQDQECDVLFDEGIRNEQRRGCEFGRDFRSLGSTCLGKGDVSLLSCNSDGTVEAIEVSDPPVQILETPAGEIVFCSQCCIDASRRFDGLDEFREESCQLGCETGLFCFEENDHRDRLGCAIGVDVLALNEFMLREEELVCVDGVVFNRQQIEAEEEEGEVDVADEEGNPNQAKDDNILPAILGFLGGFCPLLVLVGIILSRRKHGRRVKKVKSSSIVKLGNMEDFSVVANEKSSSSANPRFTILFSTTETTSSSLPLSFTNVSFLTEDAWSKRGTLFEYEQQLQRNTSPSF